MTAHIINGTAIAANLKADIKHAVEKRQQEGKRAPGLAVILVGSDPASSVYVNKKRQSCEEVGFVSKSFDLPADTTQQTLNDLVQTLNQDPEIDGILVQLPLPAHLLPVVADCRLRRDHLDLRRLGRRQKKCFNNPCNQNNFRNQLFSFGKK